MAESDSLREGVVFPGGEVVPRPESILQVVPRLDNQPEVAASDERHWRVDLALVGNSDIGMSLELRGDVVIGADTEAGEGVDVNLEEWQGSSCGVSARHVMLRPTKSKIFVMDLRSDTGTAVNGLPLGVGWAYALQNNDLITLGHLNVRVRVVQQPDD